MACCAIWYPMLKNSILMVGQNANSYSALQLCQKSVSLNPFA